MIKVILTILFILIHTFVFAEPEQDFTVWEDGIENYTITRWGGNDLVGMLNSTGPVKNFSGFARSVILVEKGSTGVFYIWSGNGRYGHRDRFLYKVDENEIVTVFMKSTGAYTGLRTKCVGGYPMWNSTDDMLYLASYNCLRRVNGDNVELVAGQCGTAGDTDGTGAAATLPYWRGSAINQDGNIYWIDAANKMRKITTAGVVTTLNIDRFRSDLVDENDIWEANPGDTYLTSGENSNTLYLSDMYDKCIWKIDIAAETAVNFIGCECDGESDPYNRSGTEADGPAIEQVGFVGGVRARYDSFHNCLWLGGSDNRKVRRYLLSNIYSDANYDAAWVKTIFGILPDGETQTSLDFDDYNGTIAPEQFNGFGSTALSFLHVIGFDHTGAFYIASANFKGAIWKVVDARD